MLKAFGNRKISLARELTKIHEEVWRTTLAEAADYYAENTPKGEFVLVIEGAGKEAEKQYTLDEAVTLAKELISGGLPLSEAAKQAAKQTGFKKGDIYSQIVKA